MIALHVNGQLKGNASFRTSQTPKTPKDTPLLRGGIPASQGSGKGLYKQTPFSQPGLPQATLLESSSPSLQHPDPF